MSEKYIGTKYVNNEWHKIYYDEDWDLTILKERDKKDLEFLYPPKKDEIAAIVAKSELIKVKKAKEAKLWKHYKKFIKEKVITTLSFLAFSIIVGGIISIFSEPTTEYEIACSHASGEEVDAITIDYAEEIINSNDTINADFRKYILGFFNKLIDLGYYNLDTINRMFNNLSDKNFEYVSIDDEDSMVIGLAEVIKDRDNISVVMISKQYYEYYYSLDASLKTRVFDAINAKPDDSLLFSIIDDGDEFYREYLCSKYNINKGKAYDAITFLTNCYRYEGDDFDKIENYISSILAYNYNFGDNFLYDLEDCTSYTSIACGDNKYSNNLFDNVIKLRINEDGYSYEKTYCPELELDLTRAEYYRKLNSKLKEFNGSINIDSANDRMLVYLHTLACLENKSEDELNKNILENGYNGYLFELGEFYFGNEFYAILDNNDDEYNMRNFCDAFYHNYVYEGFDASDINILNEFLVCMKKEKELGNIEPESYEPLEGYITSLVSDSVDEKTLLEWQDNVFVGKEYEDIGKEINEYKDDVSRLTKKII